MELRQGGDVRRRCLLDGLGPDDAGIVDDMSDAMLPDDLGRRRLGRLGVEEVDLAGAEARMRPVRLRSEEHTSELQSRGQRVCRLLQEKKTATCAANGVLLRNPRKPQPPKVAHE